MTGFLPVLVARIARRAVLEFDDRPVSGVVEEGNREALGSCSHVRPLSKE